MKLNLNDFQKKSELVIAKKSLLLIKGGTEKPKKTTHLEIKLENVLV